MAFLSLLPSVWHEIRAVNDYCCDFSNSFWDVSKRNSPSDPISPSVTNGLEKLDEAGTKIMFAASTSLNPVERMHNSTSPPLNVAPMYSGVQGFVMDGNFKLSYGNKTHGVCTTTYCIL